MSRKTKQRRRFARINAQAENAAWRDAPATPKQLKRLAFISSQTGEVFGAAITRGQASDAITFFDATEGKAPRWRPRSHEPERKPREHRRAAARRDWRFGIGQTWREHLAEIRAAQRAGLEADYMEAQRRAARER